MKHCLAVLTVLASTSAASAQCCIGAQDVSATSKNGMFRVEALSLTGTGLQQHGPYRYRFRWSDKVDGEFAVRAEFEVGYDTKAHFNMALYVSPAGNGFLVDTGIAPEIVFYHRSGQVLRTYERELMLRWFESPDDTGHFLALWDPTPVPAPGGQRAIDHSRGGELFLPVAKPVAGDLEQALLECLTPPRDDAEAVAKLIAGLASEEAAAAESAMRELEQKGGAAVDALEQAAAGTVATVGARAQRVLGQILVQQWGCARPWRDVAFISALLLYPSARVATAAIRRLDAVLSAEILKDLPSRNLRFTADWLQTHADRLAWDAAASVYRWRR